jgi:hypothetical protein
MMYPHTRAFALSLLCLMWVVAPGLAMVQSGVVSVGNNATITFPKAFVSNPTVVCSAQNGAAIMAAPTQISKTSFKVLLRDTNNNTVSSAWVQWVAALAEPGVQCGITTVSNGGSLTFPTAFTTVPTVVTSALQAGNPVMVTAINNAKNKCGVWFATHNGSSSGTVAVYWIATVPRSSWRCGVTQYSNGAALSFPALSAPPAIVTCGNCSGAVAAAGLNNSASGCSLSLRKHDNSAAGNTWVQWWAVPGGVASDAHCYRAAWGYKYNNFSYATIPWALYKDFFGAGAVENTDGTHKPSAQSWYDNTYKGVGAGGNCYGMSVSSLRLFRNALTTFHRNWFSSNGQPYAWLYPWQTQTRETAQEDQGGQLSAEMAATINDLYTNQSASTACSRISTLLASSTDRPVLAFWGSNWAHAVVPYKMTSSGNSRTVYYWDNNRAYATSETCGDDPDKGTADVSTGAISFKTGSYTATRKMICMSYSECVRTPHLPASAQGSTTTGTQVAVLTGGASLSQVESESGQRLLGPDGEMLPDPTKRLPNCLKFTPLTGSTPLKNYPGVFFFGPKAPEYLDLTCAGTGTGKSLLLYSPGQVLRLSYQGAGKVQRRAGGDYPLPGLWIRDAKLFRPSEVEFILTAGDEDIVTLRNLSVTSQGLLVKVRRVTVAGRPWALTVNAVDRPRNMIQDRDTVAVSADLVISTWVRGGRQAVTFRGLQLPPDTQTTIMPTYVNGRPTLVEVTVNRGTLLKPPWQIRP